MTAVFGDYMFLHIPRTGGTSLERALYLAYHNCCILDLPEDKHMTLDEARRKYGNRAFFTIMRSPWDIMASFYSMIKHIQTWEVKPSWFTNSYGWSACDMAQLSFEDFIIESCRRDLYRPVGGFTDVYCGDGVTEFEYEADPFNRISEWLGVELTLPHINGNYPKPKWTLKAIEAIAAHDHHDIERYGYVEPEL